MSAKPRSRSARSRGVKWPARRRGVAGLDRVSGTPPCGQAAIQHGGVVVAEQAHHPPAPGGPHRRVLVVEHDAGGVPHAERADQPGEPAGRGRHVRQRAVGVRDHVEVEIARARYVGRVKGVPCRPCSRSGGIWSTRARPGRRRRGWRPAIRRRRAHPSCSPSQPAGARVIRRFCLPLFSILSTRIGADLAGGRHMRAAAGLQVHRWSRPMRTSRSRPVPRGGLTDRVRTRPGLVSSTLSSTHRSTPGGSRRPARQARPRSPRGRAPRAGRSRGGTSRRRSGRR